MTCAPVPLQSWGAWEGAIVGNSCMVEGLQLLVPTEPPGFENSSWHFAFSSTLFLRVTPKPNAQLGVI